jgi:hypothetical protein
MARTLKDEFEYYRANQKKLVEQYGGKVIVIKDATVVGSYDSEIAALEASKNKFELGTFLIQKVEPGEEAYTQFFHSRVSFEKECTPSPPA